MNVYSPPHVSHITPCFMYFWKNARETRRHETVEKRCVNFHLFYILSPPLPDKAGHFSLL